MLVLDGGIRGLVIKIGESMSSYTLQENLVLAAQSGCILAKMARETARMGLKGLNGLRGFPASLGGAAVMNAGAYEHSFYETLQAVEIINGDGKLSTITVDDLEYGYRNTSLMQSGVVVTKVFLQMEEGIAEELTASVDMTLKSRRDKQPFELPSAGSVFKKSSRGSCWSFGRGFRSVVLCWAAPKYRKKHGNFIVNIDHATAQDVLALIDPGSSISSIKIWNYVRA